MSHCKEIHEKLSAFIDNELPSEERSLIVEHLHQCSSCAQEETSLRKIVDLLDAMPDESPASAFASIAVRLAALWKFKELVWKPVVGFIERLLYPGYGTGRRCPVSRYLCNFDDFPPESLSSIYISFIQGARK